MANSTSRTRSTTTDFQNNTVKRNLSVGTATTYYMGSMIALDASGHAVKCDDTAGLRFDGLMAGPGTNVEVSTSDTFGDKWVQSERSMLIGMTIAAATIADIGLAVYAKFDNEVALAGGVSNSIQVGWIDSVPSATFVMIRPIWLGRNGEANFDGEELTFTGATTANVIAIPDNLADALSVSEGANRYLTFNTADAGGEFMYATKPLRFLDSVGLKLGTGDDIVFTWDGTDLDVTQATVNSSIKWGVDGDGIDHVFYGATASTSMTWDQSADTLIFTGAARILWTGTTGQPEMHLTDNLADALSIEISGSTDLMVFTTTNNAESVAVRGLRTTSTTAVAIAGATALTLADSGGIFTVSQAAAYDVDLPSPTSGPGCSYFFSLTAAGANSVTLTVLGGAATFVGSIVIDDATIVATGSTLTFVSGTATLGDSIEVRSIATNLYHVRAMSSVAGGITIA